MVQEETGHVDIQTINSNQKFEDVVTNLKHVYDPEISVNIYDLGLIYKIDIKDNECNILMSLTSAFCPAADDIVNDVYGAAHKVNGIEKVDVQITFDPQWGPELMSDDAKLILGIF